MSFFFVFFLNNNFHEIYVKLNMKMNYALYNCAFKSYIWVLYILFSIPDGILLHFFPSLLNLRMNLLSTYALTRCIIVPLRSKAIYEYILFSIPDGFFQYKKNSFLLLLIRPFVYTFVAQVKSVNLFTHLSCRWRELL